MTERRSRMRRTRTGKRIALTPRDLAIFRTLARYRYLRSTYLHAFAGGASETRFKERLGDLFHEGYLDRPAEQWRLTNSLYQPAVHELGRNMRQALSVEGIADGEQRTWFRDTPHRQFEHSLMVCEILASIELGMRGHQGLRFVPWPEILAKTPESTQKSDNPFRLMARGKDDAEDVVVVPDAVFGIEYQNENRKFYRFFALEADRGTMPIARNAKTGTSILAKLEAYRNVIERDIHRHSLGIPNLLVLIVTTNETRCMEMVERCSTHRLDGRPLLFRAFSGATTPDTSLLSEPWLRPGEPSFCIADSE